MPILCEPAATAGNMARGIGGDVRSVDSLAGAARLLDADPAETLVVIGPDAGVEEAFDFTAVCRVERPGIGVVLVRHRVDVPLLQRAIQTGVREVVAAGDISALAEACARSRDVSRRVVGGSGEEHSREGQVVTVFSAKGGCGKTTIAINLAVALTSGGARRVCLVDLDLAFGDVAISIQVDPSRTIVDGLGMIGHADQTGAFSLLTECRPGLWALLAPVEPGDAERVPAALVTELIGVLRGMFDYVVIDTPSQFSEHVLAAMDASQHHVLLTTPDVPALKNLRITLDMLDLLSYHAQSRSVVLNRSDAKVGLSTEDIDRVVRAPIAARVPSSRDVPISVNQGEPITLSLPSHPVSEAIFRFGAERVLNEAPAPRQTKRSLLGRRRV